MSTKTASDVAARLDSTPRRYRAAYEKALAPKPTATGLRVAIRTMCLQCVGWERSAARDCQDQLCPLWETRRHLFTSKAAT